MKNENWGSGEWDNEPDKLNWVDEYSGYECEIIRTPKMGHLCGYVVIPESHHLHGVSYDDIEGVSVHGGLTFSDFRENEKYEVGFDCAHSGDIVPYTNKIYPNYDDVYRNIEYVKDETTRLAKQLFDMRYMDFFQAMEKMKQGYVVKSIPNAEYMKHRKFKFENGEFSCVYYEGGKWNDADRAVAFENFNLTGKWEIVK